MQCQAFRKEALMKKHKTFVEQMDKIYCKPEDFKIEYPLDVLLLTDNNIQVIKDYCDAHPQYNWPDAKEPLTKSQHFKVGNILIFRKYTVYYNTILGYNLKAYGTERAVDKNYIFI